MPNTGSTRTATRWSWCRAIALPVALAFAAGACATTTSTFYVPTSGESRFTLAEARAVLDQVVASECPRLREASKDVSQEGLIELDVDSAGAVTQARVTRTVGDPRVDAAFGGVAAGLKVDAPPPSAPRNAVGRLRAGYACGASAEGRPAAAVATLVALP
jgi:hypothetical protein